MLERVPYILKKSVEAVVSRSKRRKKSLKKVNLNKLIDNQIVDKLARGGFFEELYGPSIKGEIKKQRALAYGLK